MSNMTENQRAQFERYDLQERRPRHSQLTEGGQRFLAGLTIVFIGVLAALTYAAVQVFDGWHHLIVIADIVLIVLALAWWINSNRRETEVGS
jgi:hypothetical protein